MIWTDQVIDNVKALYLGGLSCTLIGKRYGVTRNTIIGKAHRMGWKRAGATILVRESASWNDALDARLKEMVNDGKTRSVMAAELGFSYNQVLSRCRVLGLKVTDGRVFTLAPFGATGASCNGSQRSRRLKELGAHGAPAPIINEPADPNIKGLTCVQMPVYGACRWPLTGTGADMVMCGQRSGEDTYCRFHAPLAYQPAVMSPARSQRNLERGVRRYA